MHYDPDRNLLVYENAPDPGAILSRCEGAKQLNGYTIVPAVLGNLQHLRRLDLPINTPMDRDYDWPICATYRRPTLVQRVTANFLVTHPRSFCLNDMGAMKTLSALWAADYLMTKNPGMKALVVAPLSILKDTWENEILRNFLGRRRCCILHGSAKRRAELLASDFDFYIINVDGICVGATAYQRGLKIEGLAKEIGERADIGIMIFDEGAAFRDPRSKRSRVAKWMADKREYVWLMTGSPNPTGPLDAYGLAKIVNNAFNETYTHYKDRTMKKLDTFMWKPRRGWQEMAARMLTPAVRFSINDCVDLPPCYTLPVRMAEMTPQQKHFYDEFEKECAIEVENNNYIEAVNGGALRWKLLQVACGAVYDKDHNVYHLDVAPRLNALRELLGECGEKAIVFAPLTSVVHLLYDTFKKHEACAMVHGDIPQAQRAEIFRAFRDPNHKLRIIFADPATMAHGLNLTAATVIIWFAPIDKSELYIQAIKRIDRPGQTKVTRIARIACTEAEVEMYERLQNGQSMNGVILNIVNKRRHK